MASRVRGLDHAIVAVRDLDRAQALWRRLGFTATPRGEHPEWGTANSCLMFERGYVELLTATGIGAAADRVRRFTAERQGLMSLALASDDCAHDAQRLGAPPPTSLSRGIDGAQARFLLAPLPMATTPGVDSFLCQHLTPELLRRPDWTRHANGAQALLSVTALAAEPLDLMAAWDRVFGPAAATATDETVTIHTGAGLIFLTRPEDLGQLHPDSDEEEPPPPPALVAMTVRVADTALAARLLKENGVAFGRDADGGLRIPAEETGGVFLELV